MKAAAGNGPLTANGRNANHPRAATVTEGLEGLPANDEVADPVAHGGEERANRSALLIIFLVVFIDLFGFGIVLPLLPRYGKEFMSGGESNPWTGPVLGALMASFSLMQFFCAPLWGRLSDRVGRRPILLIGLLSSVVFYSLFGVASLLGRDGWRELGLTLLFVSRVGAGIAGATLGTAAAAIADSTTAKGRARGMALIGAAFGIGFFLGPLLAFGAMTLAPENAGAPGFLAAGLSLTAFLLGVALLPETRRPGVSAARRTWVDRKGLRAALQVPNVGMLILIFFLATFAFANFEPTLALLTTARRLHLSDRNNFLLFAYVGLVLGLAQGGLYRPLARRLTEITFIRSGTVLMALGLAGVGVIAGLADVEPASTATDVSVPTSTLLGATVVDPLAWESLIGALLGTLAVAVTGFAFVTPSVQALISRLSDPARQGEILGVNQSASAMARILGPAVGVPLYYRTSTHALPYILGASLLLLVLVLSLRMRRA
jgi:MFS family permease